MTRAIVAVMLVLGAVASSAWAQTAPAGPSTLRVTVKDATDLGLPHAVVVLTDAQGVDYQAAVDPAGRGHVRGPAAWHVPGEGQRRGVPRSGAAGERATRQQRRVGRRWSWRSPRKITVSEQGADSRRDNGFTQTLTADEIDALSDDPDEMADQLDADGRAGRADLRGRLSRRPAAAEGPDPADPLQQQLVLGRVPRGRHGPRRGDHPARHGRLARARQRRLPRRVAERAQRVREHQGADAAAALQLQLPGPAVEGQDRASRCRWTATTPTIRAPSARRRRATSR